MKHLIKLTTLLFIELLLIVLIFSEFYVIGKYSNLTTSEHFLSIAIQNSILYSCFKILAYFYVGTVIGIGIIVEYKNHSLHTKAERKAFQKTMSTIDKIINKLNKEVEQSEVEDNTTSTSNNRTTKETEAIIKQTLDSADTLLYGSQDKEILDSLPNINHFLANYGKKGDNKEAYSKFSNAVVDSIKELKRKDLKVLPFIMESFHIKVVDKLVEGQPPFSNNTTLSTIDKVLEDLENILNTKVSASIIRAVCYISTLFTVDDEKVKAIVDSIKATEKSV